MGAIAGDLPFRSTDGERGEDKHAGTRIPTMWEDAVCARAPPHETLQPARKRKLEPSPQSTSPVSPRQSRERRSHETPGTFPQVRTRHTPTAQRTRTDPTGQAFPQVTSPPTQPHAPPTASQRTYRHAKSNLGDEKKKGMRMRYPAVQVLFGPRLSRAGIVAPASFPRQSCSACVYPVPAFSGLQRAGLTRPLYFSRACLTRGRR